MSVRERVLAAGTALLHEQGLGALTQPRIARAAGVSQSHLTYYFPTRNALLLAIAEHSVEQALAQPLLEPGRDPAQALAAAVAYLPRVRMLLGLVAAADREAGMREALGRLVAHVRQALAQMLSRLGYPADDAQVMVFHAAVVGLAVLNLGRRSPESEAEIEAGLRTLLALLPRPESPGRKEK